MTTTANQMTKVGQTGKMLRKHIRVHQIKLNFPYQDRGLSFLTHFNVVKVILEMAISYLCFNNL